MAERNGLDLRRLLCSAARLSERAIEFGSSRWNMPLGIVIAGVSVWWRRR